MFSLTLARKGYLNQLQYRKAHLLRMLASVAIGYVYMSIWAGISHDQSLGEYGLQGMLSYIAFNQACIWILFPTAGLGIEGMVRTGQIAHELMKPMPFFWYLLSREWGQLIYQFLYSTVPIYLIYVIFLQIQIPQHPLTWLWTLIALMLSAYIALCISYLVGITALWTTESRWLWHVHHALNMLLSGFFIPVAWLPGWLKTISLLSPYPCLQYYPTRIYLELDPVTVLGDSLIWCCLLTTAAILMTHTMRRKVEVQGG
ncbi:ABC-2 family transporter protein [Paenibacillus sp. WQ 127069]|uniref:ABC-2 family transporter protein n=1 Tax=Paenibacillus baimaensis TaxID=2982185 RepID=A0ABT2UGX7_9BACL|nr:ABC-2 family transporter protein [Paenibacillus sp. WQ 127069]MCU6793867.1 ABC-2 family transporter protein [Paenibacillus sp. WQ 127069]